MLETEKISPHICCQNLTPSLPRHPKITKNSFANTYFGQWLLTFSNQKTSEQKPSQGKSGLSQLERKRALAGAPQALSLCLAERERLGPKQWKHWVNKAFNSTIINYIKLLKVGPNIKPGPGRAAISGKVEGVGSTLVGGTTCIRSIDVFRRSQLFSDFLRMTSIDHVLARVYWTRASTCIKYTC